MRLLASVIAVLAACATSAAARPATFDGACEFSGSVRFTPPMTTAPQPVAQTAFASGTCTGTLVDRRGRAHRLDGTASAYRARSRGDAVSCAFGLASGVGSLAVGSARVRFAMTEYRGGATPLIHLVGRAGGEAWMPVTPSQSSDPVAAIQACNAGGLGRFDLDAHMQTVGTISG